MEFDADYRKMYLTMCRYTIRAIKALDTFNYGQAKELLVQGQIEAEDVYIEGLDEVESMTRMEEVWMEMEEKSDDDDWKDDDDWIDEDEQEEAPQ